MLSDDPNDSKETGPIWDNALHAWVLDDECLLADTEREQLVCMECESDIRTRMDTVYFDEWRLERENAGLPLDWPRIIWAGR